MNGLESIAIQFYTAGSKYSAAIQPYALKLLLALLLIDIFVTWIQFTPKDVRATALLPSVASAGTPIVPRTTSFTKGYGSTAIGKPTTKLLIGIFSAP